MTVTRNILEPLYVKFREEYGGCGDGWNDSLLGNLRSELPPTYHAIPLDELRKQIVNLRKRISVENPRTKNGRGLPDVPPEYLEYLNSPERIRRREWFLDYWGRKCSVCFSPATMGYPLNVHHRTYERVKAGQQEHRTDCIVLCRPCHVLFHKAEKNKHGDIDLFNSRM